MVLNSWCLNSEIGPINAAHTEERVVRLRLQLSTRSDMSRFGPKDGHIGPECDKSRTFSDQMPVYFVLSA